MFNYTLCINARLSSSHSFGLRFPRSDAAGRLVRSRSLSISNEAPVQITSRHRKHTFLHNKDGRLTGNQSSEELKHVIPDPRLGIPLSPASDIKSTVCYLKLLECRECNARLNAVRQDDIPYIYPTRRFPFSASVHVATTGAILFLNLLRAPFPPG